MWRTILFLAIVVISLGLVACNGKLVYEADIEIPPNGWHKDNIAKFHFEIDDTSVPYNLFLKVENTEDYSCSNLWLFVSTRHESGFVTRDTLECMLAAPNGRWYGSGWSSDYSLTVPFKQMAGFKEKGGYSVFVQQAMRKEDGVLQGITHVGFKVEKAK